MKKLVNVLFVLGATILGFSQNINGKMQREELKNVVITNINFSYLEKVQDSSTADFVKTMETVASRYKIEELSQFDGRKEAFEIIFRGSKGVLVATYDNHGKILKTTETYKDFKISKNLRNSVLKKYPNSSFLKVFYTVNYDNQNNIAKIYHIKIKNDKVVKSLKICSYGNVNNALTMNIEN